MNNSTVSVGAQVGVTLTHFVEYLLKFFAFGEGVKLGPAFWRQAGVSSLRPDRWGSVGSVYHGVMLPALPATSADGLVLRRLEGRGSCGVPGFQPAQEGCLALGGSAAGD